MRYTTLRVTPTGVFLRPWHRGRLAPEGDGVLAAFDRWADEARPGVYGLQARDGALVVTARTGSALFDGIPTRWAPSPVAAAAGPMDKAPSPGPYDEVRRPGMETLLTDADGGEVLESCRAVILAWNGGLVAPPADRPVVRSVTLAALDTRLPIARAPIPADGPAPLLLLNAVIGACVPAVDGRDPFPPAAVAEIRRILASL